jgi:hypothetical protein
MESLFLTDNFLCCLLNWLIVILIENIVTAVSIIKETVICRRTMAKMDTEFSFHRLTEDVSTRVPENHFTLGVIKSYKLELAITLKRTETIVKLPVLSLLCILSIWVDKASIKSANAIKELDLCNYHLFWKAIGQLLSDI